MDIKTQRLLSFCNIVLVIIILMDFLLPGRITPVLELDSFYNTTVKISNGRKPSFVDRSILLLTNGETFRLAKIPDSTYAKGQKIKIVKSSFSNNIKQVIILGEVNKIENVSLLSFRLVQIFVLVSVASSLMNLLFNSKFVNILLIASTLFTFIFSIGYLFK